MTIESEPQTPDARPPFGLRELLIRDIGNDEAEITLDVVIPWPMVLEIVRAIDLGSYNQVG